MSNPAHVKLIARLYGAFANGDADAMAACYHRSALFSDPVFGQLQGAEIGDMWRMLISRSKGNLAISFSHLGANDEKGRANWTADYTFGATGRKVHNAIRAEFRFKDGLIAEHRDHFPFWKWAGQALGSTGWLLGWTPALRRKIRLNARMALEDFRKAKT